MNIKDRPGMFLVLWQSHSIPMYPMYRQGLIKNRQCLENVVMGIFL